MGSLYRSEPMALCQLFLQNDSAFESVAQLGELALCQFRDLNGDLSPHQRKFVNDVKRCNEMERRIRFFEAELTEHGIAAPDSMTAVAAPLPRDMLDLEAKFEKLEDELQLINQSTASLRTNYLHMSDVRHVLIRIRQILQEGERGRAAQSLSEAEQGYSGPFEIHTGAGGLNGHTNHAMDLSTAELAAVTKPPLPVEPSEIRLTAGVVDRAHVLAFERVLWRMCHGKVYMRTADIEEEEEALFKNERQQSAFLIFYTSGQLDSKVRRICGAFHARILDNLSDSAIGRAELLTNVSRRLDEMRTVITKTFEHHERVLNAAALNVRVWQIQVIKLKSTFHTLNMFNLDITHKCLIAECWVPSRRIPEIRATLQLATELSGATVSSVLQTMDFGHETPPTYNAVNKFTVAFQNIVDSYGIANYQEINPAPWTIVTFPFLFAMMFGDCGHGLLMFLAALGLVAFERRIEAAKIRDEIFTTFYGGRYVILLMGAFAIYTGAIYNDVFSKSMNLVDSSWRNPFNISSLEKSVIDPAIADKMSLVFWPTHSYDRERGPYPLGLDPVWNLAVNRLNFLNPMKMKMSILVGVSQMFFGVMLSLLNYRFKNSKLDIYFVFIPQVLFLSLIFVYLCIQVVLKWIFFTVEPGWVLGQYYPTSECAPSLLIGLINMFMFKSRDAGFVNGDDSDCLTTNPASCPIRDQCHLQLWYPYQDKVEAVFIIVAVVCIPVMLLVKPLVLWSRARRGQMVDTGHGLVDSAEFNMGDVMVYQAIHTIEFALGCISHTASYLRLWALSLAHAQLSDVLWTMMLRNGLVLRGGVIAILLQLAAFLVFGVLSVAILVLMEGLSAFLHALRLHWVEFQSKFYGGDGILFEPLSFAKQIRLHDGFDS